MQAVIALILANLPAIISAGKAGFDFIQSVRQSAQQAGEWTADMELEFQSKLAGEAIDPAWLPDAAVETAALVTAPAPGRGILPVTFEAPPVVASAAVTCPICLKELIPDHPANCNCVSA